MVRFTTGNPTSGINLYFPYVTVMGQFHQRQLILAKDLFHLTLPGNSLSLRDVKAGTMEEHQWLAYWLSHAQIAFASLCLKKNGTSNRGQSASHISYQTIQLLTDLPSGQLFI